MTSKERFNQNIAIANALGPISDPVKELYCLVSIGKDGHEGLVSFSLSDDPPTMMQCCVSDRDLVNTILLRGAAEVLPELANRELRLELRRYVFAEKLEEIGQFDISDSPI